MKTPARTSATLLLATILSGAVAQQPPVPVPGSPGGLPSGVPGAGAGGPPSAFAPGGLQPPQPKRDSARPGAGVPGMPMPTPGKAPSGGGTNYGGIPTSAPAAPIPPRSGPDIIREAKLKVLQEHYEKTFQECIQLERELLLATPEDRPKIEATARALKSFLAKLEAELLPLTGKPASRKNTLPGFDSDPSIGPGALPPTAPPVVPGPGGASASAGFDGSAPTTTTPATGAGAPPAIPGLDILPPGYSAPPTTTTRPPTPPPSIPGAGAPPAIPGLDILPPGYSTPPATPPRPPTPPPVPGAGGPPAIPGLDSNSPVGAGFYPPTTQPPITGAGGPGLEVVPPSATPRQTTDRARKRFETARKQYEAGSLPEADFIAAQLDLARTLAQGDPVKTAEAQLSAATQMLDLAQRNRPATGAAPGNIPDVETARKRKDEAEILLQRAREIPNSTPPPSAQNTPARR